MGLVLESNEVGRTRFAIRDEPEFIVPLEIGPPALEEVLSNGKWLVVGISVWSSYDVRAAGEAIRLVKAYHGFVQLGLRPVDDPNECSTWIPRQATFSRVAAEASDRRDNFTSLIESRSDLSASPVWVSLSGGKLIELHDGLLDRLEIIKILDRLLAA